MVVSTLSRTLAVAQDVSFAAICIEGIREFSSLKAPNGGGFTGVMADIADRPRARLYKNYG